MLFINWMKLILDSLWSEGPDDMFEFSFLLIITFMGLILGLAILALDLLLLPFYMFSAATWIVYKIIYNIVKGENK